MNLTPMPAVSKQRPFTFLQTVRSKAGKAFDTITSALMMGSARVIAFSLYIVIRYVVRYRQSVIIKNLSTSFPGKSAAEIRILTNNYYKHLSDLVVEPFLFVMAPAALRRKLVTYSNLQLIEQHYKDHKPVIVFASHYGNWEYMINLPEFTEYPVYTAYTTINNGPLNRLMISLRSLFGVKLIPKESFYRKGLTLLRERTQPNLVVIIADQRPAPGNDKFRIPFMDQDTAVQTGGERMAASSDAEIVFIACRKRGQFKYEYTFSQTATASAAVPLSITKAYYKVLENSIDQSPGFWLWSHNRWRKAVSMTAE